MLSFFNIINFWRCWRSAFVTFCIFVKNRYASKSIWNVSITWWDSKTMADLSALDTIPSRNPNTRVWQLRFQGLSTSRKRGFVNFCKNYELFFQKCDLSQAAGTDKNLFGQKLGAHTPSSLIWKDFSVGPLPSEIQPLDRVPQNFCIFVRISKHIIKSSKHTLVTSEMIATAKAPFQKLKTIQMISVCSLIPEDFVKFCIFCK